MPNDVHDEFKNKNKTNYFNEINIESLLNVMLLTRNILLTRVHVPYKLYEFIIIISPLCL